MVEAIHERRLARKEAPTGRPALAAAPLTASSSAAASAPTSLPATVSRLGSEFGSMMDALTVLHQHRDFVASVLGRADAVVEFFTLLKDITNYFALTEVLMRKIKREVSQCQCQCRAAHAAAPPALVDSIVNMLINCAEPCALLYSELLPIYSKLTDATRDAKAQLRSQHVGTAMNGLALAICSIFAIVLDTTGHATGSAVAGLSGFNSLRDLRAVLTKNVAFTSEELARLAELKDGTEVIVDALFYTEKHLGVAGLEMEDGDLDALQRELDSVESICHLGLQRMANTSRFMREVQSYMREKEEQKCNAAAGVEHMV